MLPDRIWRKRSLQQGGTLGAAEHPAIRAARELHIRPKRKFLRRSSTKSFFITNSLSLHDLKPTVLVGL